MVFLVDPSSPAEEWPRFLGAADDRPCELSCYERFMRPLRSAYWIPLILLTQTPRLLKNRFMWFVFRDLYSSGCRVCGGTGKSTVRPGGGPWSDFPNTREKVITNCSICNGFHD